jgi:hypothetical protein
LVSITCLWKGTLPYFFSAHGTGVRGHSSLTFRFR